MHVYGWPLWLLALFHVPVANVFYWHLVLLHGFFRYSSHQLYRVRLNGKEIGIPQLSKHNEGFNLQTSKILQTNKSCSWFANIHVTPTACSLFTRWCWFQLLTSCLSSDAVRICATGSFRINQPQLAVIDNVKVQQTPS